MCQFRTNHRTTGMCGHPEVMLYRARTSIVPVSSGGDMVVGTWWWGTWWWGHGGGGHGGGDMVVETWWWGTWWWGHGGGGHGGWGTRWGGHGGGGTHRETSFCVHV